ncbi:uncharacterized protein BN736_00235 [Prevotella sp. CAG:617]|nr:uncharacterized protein BN736_00235 [Prevotella sp. CAG:617]
MLVRTAPHGGIGYPPYAVFLFQVHVYHQRVPRPLEILCRHAQRQHPLGRPLIHFHLVHHIGRQIFKCHGRVTLKEVLAIHQQTLYLLSVDINLTARLQLHARQHGNQLVEHGAGAQLEGVGIIHNRIALHHHLDTGGLHYGLRQHAVAGRRFLAHQHFAKRTTGHTVLTVLEIHILISGFIAFFGKPNDVFSRCFQVFRKLPPTIFLADKPLGYSTVGAHEYHFYRIQILSRKGIVNKSIHIV